MTKREAAVSGIMAQVRALVAKSSFCETWKSSSAFLVDKLNQYDSAPEDEATGEREPDHVDARLRDMVRQAYTTARMESADFVLSVIAETIVEIRSDLRQLAATVRR